MATRQEQPLLVLRSQAGDRAAQDELLRRVQEPLYNYLRWLSGDAHLAEDILQEVFVLCLRNLRWLRDVNLFESWLYRIASRECFRSLARHRKHAQHEPESLALSVPAPDETPVLDAEEREALHSRVEHLSPASRAVLLLHYMQGLTLESVADVLGLALGTVKSRLAYGLTTLRENYSGDER
jgi:RNA polymerase sigma-70 factor, ECF subfamily